MKNYTTLGVILGIAIAIALYLGDIMLLFLIIVCGGIGGVIGAHFDGRINIVQVWNNIIGKGQG